MRERDRKEAFGVGETAGTRRAGSQESKHFEEEGPVHGAACRWRPGRMLLRLGCGWWQQHRPRTEQLGTSAWACRSNLNLYGGVI